MPPSSAIVTIADNEPEVSIAATDPDAAEEGADPGAFTVTRTGETSGALVVAYTVSGDATAGSDYTALSGSVTIPAGSSSAEIPILSLEDGLPESSETIILTLGSGAYEISSPSTDTVTLLDNDIPGVTVAPLEPVKALGSVIQAGNPPESWTTSYDPFNTLYHDSRTQFVILASELASAGLIPTEPITSIQLHCWSVHGRPNLRNFRVRLKHTSNTTSTSTVS